MHFLFPTLFLMIGVFDAMQFKSDSLVEQATQEIYVEEQVEISQQPTQKIDLGQQETLPMVLKKEERPTLSIQVHPHNSDQHSSPSQNKRQRRQPNTSLLLWLPLLSFVVLLFGVLIGHSAIQSWISQHITPHASSTPVVSVIHAQSTPIPSTIVDKTAKLFMDAMLRKDWATMWLMLSPDAQQLWAGEKDFIHFEKAKFGSLIFTSFNASSVQLHTTWRDPDTTEIYSDVHVMHVSLAATAPRGLLSAPSNLALSKGLFTNMLFSLIHYQNTWRVLIAGPADPDAPILVPFTPPVTKLLVPIFMYHHVSNLPVRNYLDFNLTVTSTNFDTQLDWFKQHDYHSISQTELFDALYYGKVLPAHPLILTFDDGYEDVYTYALPVLLAHHYRGVFYIITGFTGRNYMTWNQVRILAQDGMQIASHTIHHVNVGQPPAGTSTQEELLLSKETLETQLGIPIQFFCYPTGEPFHLDPVYEQQKVLADLFLDGYVGATLDPFSYDSAIQNAQTPYQLPRLRVSGGESMQLFISILNSTLQIDAYRLAKGFAY